jgi:hypothetical protein
MYWINKLAPEKDLADWQRAELDSDLAKEVFSTKDASFWLDTLFAARNRPQPVLDIETGQPRARVSEEGFYLADGQVFKVVLARTTGNLYAKQTSASGLVYVPGAMNKLFADQKLTADQLAAQGLTQGYCVVCSSEFEDPTSKHIGIGPTCGKNQLGPDAYKALRLTVADRPDVVAFEAAKKAKAKEAREAKKIEQAQLVLV